MSTPLRILILLLSFMMISLSSMSQSNLRWKKVYVQNDTIQLDSLTIFQNSLRVFCGESLLTQNDYYFNGNTRSFYLKYPCGDTLQFRYRVFDIDFQKPVQRIDTTIIYKNDGNITDFYYRDEDDRFDFFGEDEIKKSGSISRGISFGNAQDLSVNSSLNLQLSGKIADNVNILATVTDNNLPIQPDGNTSQLQEFDQVFIQLYGEEYKVIVGDYWLKKPKGYFLNYNKRAQGIFGQYVMGKESEKWMIQGGGALSKGKFSRNTIQGVEGNQGPYKLRGKENEPYIIVLSGTENVYLDGKLMQRGQEFDYVIDYNTAELTFTPRHIITKDIRIVVEFQYSDQNYARSVFVANTEYQGEKLDFWLNIFSEQDAKNQSLQQKLSSKEKLFLSKLGDSIQYALSNSIDSIGFMDNQVTYKMVDSLGIDSILVYSVNPDSAYYRASFMNVGTGKGNYVFDRYTAVGKVYKWVAPIGGQPQGDFEPSRLIITPKRNTMISSGIEYRFNDKWKARTEISTSYRDQNTFSKIHKDDNRGYSNKTYIEGIHKLGKDSLTTWKFKTVVDFEYTSKYFQEVERYRSIEFDRDWNVRGKNYTGDQYVSLLSFQFLNIKYGSIELQAQNLAFGKDYLGNKGRLLGEWNQKGLHASVDASYLDSKSDLQNSYVRHKSDINQTIGPIKIGFEDDHERNVFKENTLLRLDSYQWYDWKVYFGSSDSLINQFQLFYSERYDWRSDSTRLEEAAIARTIGANFDWLSSQNSILKTMVSYRKLDIKTPTLINQQPENTFLGRVDYSLNLWKKALNFTLFYEIGSGLELRKEFLYIEVAAGQGVYTWIDYNNDGIKDLNEFEIAQYPDQAKYVRVFTPSDEYVRTYSNELNQSLFWRPERIWSNKQGILRFLARISDQVRFRVYKKVSDANWEMYNPISRSIADTSLLSLNSSIKNTFFFNRTSPIAGGDYTYSQTNSKYMIASGFDGKSQEYHSVSLRWNLVKVLTIKTSGELGEKRAIVDYTVGRNYSINYHNIKPEIIYQPNTIFRISLEGRYEEKRNQASFGGERAFLSDIGVSIKWNQLDKGSLNGEFKFINIVYNGSQNNSVSYELLESLKSGKNFTWGIGYQRNIVKNLQVNIQYNGRKSENNRVIHTGGVEVRAFF
ncbi:MAG: hypothetical protein M9897_13440 [Brumimicrobium sp.]|nr:hypothetical protein [Brumimicrobium sp.]